MLLHGRRAGPVLAVAALLLTGCTGGDRGLSPAPTPTGSGTVFPSPTPAATTAPATEPAAPPLAPPEQVRTDEVGAAAAAEYFLRLYGYTMQTGDVAPWDAMTGQPCQFCARTRDLALSIEAAGELFSGAEITPVETFVHPFDDLVGGYPVDVEFSQTEGLHTDAAGNVINEIPADSGIFGVDLVHLDGGWKVFAVTAQDS